MTFNARLGAAEGDKSVLYQDILGFILALHVSHDAQLDSRGMLGSCRYVFHYTGLYTIF